MYRIHLSICWHLPSYCNRRPLLFLGVPLGSEFKSAFLQEEVSQWQDDVIQLPTLPLVNHMLLIQL